MRLSPSEPSATAPGASDLDAPSCTTHVPLFGHQLVSLGRNWRRVLELRLAELGLSDATWVPLFHLHAGGDGISLKALAQRVGLDSSTLVRVVDLLEARGLLLRETDSQDRRSKLLRITPAGSAAIAELHVKLHLAETQLLDGMDAATIEALRQGMAQLAQRMADVLAQQGADAGTPTPR